MIIRSDAVTPPTMRFYLLDVDGATRSPADLSEGVTAALHTPTSAVSNRTCTVADTITGAVDVDMADVTWTLGKYVLAFSVDGVAFANEDIWVTAPGPERAIRAAQSYL